MKRLTILGLILAAGTAMADPVEGLWKTLPDDNGNFGHVKMAPCGEKICGKLVAAFDAKGAKRESDNIGKAIVWDMVPAGDGSYAEGMIWAPDRDKTYASKMTLSGDALSVSGCVMGGLICRSQEWTRVK
jgi:uncharacterized protein (DUF2147 family)